MSSTTKITSDKAPVELGNVLTPSEQELARLLIGIIIFSL